MIYFLKKSTPSKKGLYLQIYTNFYDPNTKKKNTKSYKSLGYVSDLIASGIEDPIAYYSEVVKKMNKELNDSTNTLKRNLKETLLQHLATSLKNVINDDLKNDLSNLKSFY